MAQRCALTGKDTQFGCNVSHSQRHTNRRFQPNIQKVSLSSEALGREFRLRVAVRTLRSVQKKGGLDRFLLGTADAKLMPGAQRIKRQIQKKLSGQRRLTAQA